MSDATHSVRTQETHQAIAWPARTETVSRIGEACVVQGNGDFELADLNAVRGRFPGRHVTLDGDVITVWPPAPQYERVDFAHLAADTNE